MSAIETIAAPQKTSANGASPRIPADDEHQNPGDAGRGDGRRDPPQLRADDAGRATKAQHDRAQRNEQEDDAEEDGRLLERVDHAGESVDPRADSRPSPSPSNTPGRTTESTSATASTRASDDHDAPAGRAKPAVGSSTSTSTSRRKKTFQASEATSAAQGAPDTAPGLSSANSNVAVACGRSRETEPDAEHQPPDRVTGLAGGDESADSGEREHERDARGDLEAVAVPASVEDGADDEERHGERRAPPTRRRRSSHRGASRSQSEACAGCIVSVTTSRRSRSSVPRSICSRSRAPKPSSVRCAS